jgi:hypothetical protein
MIMIRENFLIHKIKDESWLDDDVARGKVVPY